MPRQLVERYQMDNLDLLTIGDATIDVFITPLESETMCKLDTKECLICFSYGDKIPTRELVTVVGGNASNNAVGCTRLGVSTSLVLSLGDDDFGRVIVEKLKKENVGMDYVVQVKGDKSNYNTVINYSGERTIFVYHAPRNYAFPANLQKPKWVYLTSMGEEFPKFFEQFVAWKKQNPDVRLAFNPGSWQFRAGTQALTEVLSLTDVLFVNRQEAEKLTGMKESLNNEKELLKSVVALGVKTPIITDGGNGVFVYQDNRFLKCGVLPVDAYERTGAGDAFGSGCLSAIIKGKSIEDALLWGTLNSASVIGFIGPQQGLIKESEMEIWLERAKSSGVKVEEF